jgi:hypothetical protein
VAPGGRPGRDVLCYNSSEVKPEYVGRSVTNEHQRTAKGSEFGELSIKTETAGTDLIDLIDLPHMYTKKTLFFIEYNMCAKSNKNWHLSGIETKDEYSSLNRYQITCFMSASVAS